MVKTLAVPSARLERFAIALANFGANDEDSRALALIEEYREFFPADFPQNSFFLRKTAETEAIVGKGALSARLTESELLDRRLKPFRLFALLLHKAWIEQDERKKDYRFFAVRAQFHRETSPTSEHQEPPDNTLFDRSIFRVQANLSKAKYCKNPECPAPHFIVTEGQRTYCGRAECKKYGQKKAKLDHWNRVAKFNRPRKARKKK